MERKPALRAEESPARAGAKGRSSTGPAAPWLAVLILLFAARTAWANPATARVTEFTICEIGALLGEALVVAALLWRRHHFYFLRTVLAWLLVTTATLYVMVLALMTIETAIGLLLIPLALLELLVLAGEAAIMRQLSRVKLLAARTPNMLGWKPALAISGAGNLMSIYFALFLYPFLRL